MIGDDDTVAYPGLGPPAGAEAGAGAADPIASTPSGAGAGGAGASLAWRGAERIAGRYQLRGWLGSGGMGTVYRADDVELGEPVALKVIRPQLVGDPAALERFRREVKLARRISHRNVARMHDIGEHEGAKFLTMELVEGESLGRRLADAGPMSAGRAAAIGVELCAGLDAAHQAGVVHRDLKPDNILVALDGRIVITDFGIARAATSPEPGATGVATVIGTPAYMSPEQLEGRPDVDARADLWAVGVILYELVTGARPWQATSPVGIALAQSRAPAPDPRAVRADVPAELAAVIRRCLAPDPHARYGSAAELGADLTTAAPILTSTPLTMTAAAAAARRPAETAIAVLPFRHAPDDAYLALGLVEDVTDTLSMTAGLKVRPLGAASRVGAGGDPREAGRALEVEHVVEGSLRRTPAGLRVTTRLVHVGDGFQIWAQRTDCAEADVLEVGGAIARGVAEALSTRAAGSARPTDPRVVELYLRARHEMRKFWREPMERAATLLEEARRLAPDSPAILATLAYARVRLWAVVAQPHLAGAARAAAAAAMAAAPELGEARLARGLIELNDGDQAQAAADFGYAVRRAASLPEAHLQAGLLVVESGDLVEARARFDAAAALDPGQAPAVECELARLDALAGDSAAAEARLERVAATGEPALVRMAAFYRARVTLWRGDLDGAAALAERTAGTDRAGSFALFFADLARGRGLPEDGWRRWLERMRVDGAARRTRLFATQVLAEAALGAGRADLAIEALAWAVDHGFRDAHWWASCPLVTPLAARPDVAALGARVATEAARVLAAYRRGLEA